ncbi:MAG TPA: ABC transporter substrate-binding protein [Pseudonocardiaceae bacterium]|nr:ABC transporter substrate-binding protein [Pseudonocardiaceae bacterium]
MVTVTTGSTGAFVDNFNPYSPNVQDAANGMIYEPMFYFNTLKTDDITPWLGTSYTWSNGGRTLQFQLRHNVTWTDGKPFTSADVVFTLNLALHNQALNKYALPLADVTANGPYALTVDFTKPAYEDLYYVAGKVGIVPQHIWQSIPNPTTWQNPKPVGTGAYELSKISSQSEEFTANPHYYQPGLPKVKELRFLAFSGNESADAAIVSGQVDWAGGFIPNIKTAYVAHDPKYTLVNLPLATNVLIPNYVSGPTAQLPVRQAISAALDRDFISNTVYDGETPPSNPEALLTPNFSSVLDPALAGSKLGGPNVAKAKGILQAAGYHLGANQIFVGPDGAPLNITIKVISGYTDYVSTLQIVVQELKAAGINLTVDGQSYAAFTADQDTGNFQLIINAFGFTPSPYSYYDEMLDSSIAPPIGQTDTVGNYGRYHNDQVNSLLTDIANHQDETSALPDFYQIEQIVTQDIPVIPLFEAQDEIEFNGHHVTGFPTQQNPYAAAAVYMQPDIGWVAMRLSSPTS